VHIAKTVYCCQVCGHYFILGGRGEYVIISREAATALVLAGLHTFKAAWCPVCRDMSGRIWEPRRAGTPLDAVVV